MSIKREARIDGTSCYVPLGKDGKQGECRIDLASYNYLMSSGISPNWFVNTYGYVAVSVNYVPKLVSRLLLTPKNKGHTVKYRDGNKLNLTSANICIEKRPGNPNWWKGVLKTLGEAA